MGAYQHITYRELKHNVSRVANALLAHGVRRGDRVCVYMPMISETAYVMLACARIGAIHSVIFAGFSGEAIADRIQAYQLQVQDKEAMTATERELDQVACVLVGGAGEFSVLQAGELPWLRGFIDFMGWLAERGFPTFASCFGFLALVVRKGVAQKEADNERGVIISTASVAATGSSAVCSTLF